MSSTLSFKREGNFFFFFFFFQKNNWKWGQFHVLSIRFAMEQLQGFVVQVSVMWTYFTSYSSISITDSEQVIAWSIKSHCLHIAQYCSLQYRRVFFVKGLLIWYVRKICQKNLHFLPPDTPTYVCFSENFANVLNEWSLKEDFCRQWETRKKGNSEILYRCRGPKEKWLVYLWWEGRKFLGE